MQAMNDLTGWVSSTFHLPISYNSIACVQYSFCICLQLLREKKRRRKYYNFQRKFNEKLSVIPGCPKAAAACMGDAQPRQHKDGCTSGLEDDLI